MIIQGLLGLAFFLGLAWLSSEHRRAVSVRGMLAGLGLQFLIALILLKQPFFREFFLALNRLILSLEECSRAGTALVFGYLGGGPEPYEVTQPAASYILAFRGLPLVLVISALSSLLFYWKILPLVVRGFSWALQKSLRIGGAEGVAIGANVFLGMVEAPLFVRPYLKHMTRSELFAVMTCGMATIAGTVMVLYASILSAAVPDVMGHILTASIISAPAAITIAKVMIPETGQLTAGQIVAPEEAKGSIDAITQGTIRGIGLLINIIAMLVVLVALVHLVNLTLSLLPRLGGENLTLQRALGWVMAPFVWLIGIPWGEAFTAGQLMGTKTIFNELLAYLELSRLPAGSLSERSSIIMTYALCGFANPGSLGIMIGGLGTMAPERRAEIVNLGLRSVVAGTLATLMTAAMVGLIT